MGRSTEFNPSDSATRAMERLGERWTFLVLREAFFGVRRFSALQRNLGISRNVLSARLSALVELGILKRRRYRTDPDFYEYLLTARGRDLYPAILAFTEWGERYLAAGESPPPPRLRHKSCGAIVHARLVCGACGEDIDAREIEVVMRDAA
jgi:DNA-binding HxlR family transcriptional regulator